MKNFAALDFETANARRQSVCSLGLVVVRQGQIVDRFYSLIKPVPDYYSRFNIGIHGITPDDTRDAPAFPEVWAQVVPRIGDLPLVAHNSAFDESCLKAVMQCYDMEYPGYRFYCTCRASKNYFGSRLPNHQLQTVADAVGFDLINHHDALADAEACAAIAVAIL